MGLTSQVRAPMFPRFLRPPMFPRSQVSSQVAGPSGLSSQIPSLWCPRFRSQVAGLRFIGPNSECLGGLRSKISCPGSQVPLPRCLDLRSRVLDLQSQDTGFRYGRGSQSKSKVSSLRSQLANNFLHNFNIQIAR